MLHASWRSRPQEGRHRHAAVDAAALDPRLESAQCCRPARAPLLTHVVVLIDGAAARRELHAARIAARPAARRQEQRTLCGEGGWEAEGRGACVCALAREGARRRAKRLVGDSGNRCAGAGLSATPISSRSAAPRRAPPRAPPCAALLSSRCASPPARLPLPHSLAATSRALTPPPRQVAHAHRPHSPFSLATSRMRALAARRRLAARRPGARTTTVASSSTDTRSSLRRRRGEARMDAATLGVAWRRRGVCV